MRYYLQEYNVASPSGKLNMTVQTGKSLSYSLSVDGETVMTDCAMSMTLADSRVLGHDARIRKAEKAAVNETINSPFYRQSSFETAYNSLLLKFTGDWSLEIRAYDDGVAYRFLTDFRKNYEEQQTKMNIFLHERTKGKVIEHLPLSFNHRYTYLRMPE